LFGGSSFLYERCCLVQIKPLTWQQSHNSSTPKNKPILEVTTAILVQYLKYPVLFSRAIDHDGSAFSIFGRAIQNGKLATADFLTRMYMLIVLPCHAIYLVKPEQDYCATYQDHCIGAFKGKSFFSKLGVSATSHLARLDWQESYEKGD